MTPDFPEQNLFAAYRDRTRARPPGSFAGAIQERLSRPPAILPGVALACLVSSIGFTVVGTLLLSQPGGTARDSFREPPPLFQGSRQGLFKAVDPVLR